MFKSSRTADGSYPLSMELPAIQVEPELTDALFPRLMKFHFIDWVLHSDAARDYFESNRSYDQKMPILNWYQLTCNRGRVLFNNMTPKERAHDPAFLKGWAAGITVVYCKPPKRYRSFFGGVRGGYTLNVCPSIGVLRWLASLACRKPKSVATVWSTRFETVCKFNPYSLSLLAMGGDLCFPYEMREVLSRPARSRNQPLRPSNDEFARPNDSDEDESVVFDNEYTGYTDDSGSDY